MTRGKILALILAAALFLTGLWLLHWPAWRTAVEQSKEQQIIRDFDAYVRAGRDAPAALPDASDGSTLQRPFDDLWDACQAYNRSIAEEHQSLFSQDTITQPQICLSDYGWEQDSFGYISIPAAEIEEPLYLGASSGNLDKGGGVLGQTSIPIGGASTNAVIVGHRTWDTAVKFKGLDQLQPGDLVYITNPWETLIYSVVEVKIIQPNDTDQILIQDGRDLISVITCTYPNTRRVLVICERELEKQTP